jgi:hypothetical protein
MDVLAPCPRFAPTLRGKPRFPQGTQARFERYREAWCLMACQHDGKCNPASTLRTDCKARAARICPAIADPATPPTGLSS